MSADDVSNTQRPEMLVFDVRGATDYQLDAVADRMFDALMAMRATNLRRYHVDQMTDGDDGR